jgi:hypothetical protein
MGIERHDRDRRAAQYRRNFAFFDAPAAAFLFAHEALGSYAVLDAGVFLQSFMLAAAAEGLGTCAQASLASYPQVVRRHFAVPDGYRLLCGVSLGWPAEAPENRFRPDRMTTEELLIPRRPPAFAPGRIVDVRTRRPGTERRRRGRSAPRPLGQCAFRVAARRHLQNGRARRQERARIVVFQPCRGCHLTSRCRHATPFESTSATRRRPQNTAQAASAPRTRRASRFRTAGLGRSHPAPRPGRRRTTTITLR